MFAEPCSCRDLFQTFCFCWVNDLSADQHLTCSRWTTPQWQQKHTQDIGAMAANEATKQWWLKAGPTSQTLVQLLTIIGLTFKSAMLSKAFREIRVPRTSPIEYTSLDPVRPNTSAQIPLGRARQCLVIYGKRTGKWFVNCGWDESRSRHGVTLECQIYRTGDSTTMYR